MTKEPKGERMKKITVLMMALVMSACAVSFSAAADEEIDEAAITDFTNYTTIITEGVVDEPVELRQHHLRNRI